MHALSTIPNPQNKYIAEFVRRRSIILTFARTLRQDKKKEKEGQQFLGSITLETCIQTEKKIQLVGRLKSKSSLYSLPKL